MPQPIQENTSIHKIEKRGTLDASPEDGKILDKYIDTKTFSQTDAKLLKDFILRMPKEKRDTVFKAIELFKSNHPNGKFFTYNKHDTANEASYDPYVNDNISMTPLSMARIRDGKTTSKDFVDTIFEHEIIHQKMDYFANSLRDDKLASEKKHQIELL